MPGSCPRVAEHDPQPVEDDFDDLSEDDLEDAFEDEDEGADSTPPTLYEDGEVRRLYFGPDYIQSEMLLADPVALQLRYTQRMMAWLLFVPRPKSIAIVGLGGGSLTKFCLAKLPKTRITTVELDRRVIAMSRAFDVPAASPRNRIVHAEACAWFSTCEERFDVILLDAYTDEGIASGFGEPAFYARLRSLLRPEGMLVANILVRPMAFRRYRQVIEDAFDGRALTTRIAVDGNQVVFAFNPPRAPFDWVRLAQDAKKLSLRHDLDVPAAVRALRRASERGDALPDDDGGVALL